LHSRLSKSRLNPKIELLIKKSLDSEIITVIKGRSKNFHYKYLAVEQFSLIRYDMWSIFYIGNVYLVYRLSGYRELTCGRMSHLLSIYFHLFHRLVLLYKLIMHKIMPDGTAYGRNSLLALSKAFNEGIVSLPTLKYYCYPKSLVYEFSLLNSTVTRNSRLFEVIFISLGRKRIFLKPFSYSKFRLFDHFLLYEF